MQGQQREPSSSGSDGPGSWCLQSEAADRGRLPRSPSFGCREPRGNAPTVQLAWLLGMKHSCELQMLLLGARAHPGAAGGARAPPCPWRSRDVSKFSFPHLGSLVRSHGCNQQAGEQHQGGKGAAAAGAPAAADVGLSGTVSVIMENCCRINITVLGRAIVQQPQVPFGASGRHQF